MTQSERIEQIIKTKEIKYMEAQISVSVNLSQCIGQLNEEEALELIKEIDLHHASVDFTLSAMKWMYQSLLTDSTKEEILKDIGALE